ncbi:DedA family protein [Oleisolibacter albus]|uniref:DedA family protein n=1 Tax=Oleisolibacter albus TaxID=2171757 RepID=UPI000DF42441|nr:DedA family protein [Oleisolibacter albus]
MFDWVLSVVEQAGYLGLLALMFLENLFPPIPSELIMPLAGFLAAQGKMDPLLVVLTGTAGSVLGALPWYYAGRLLGRARLAGLAGRYGFLLTIDPPDVDRAYDWFRRYGGTAVLAGRLVPAIRTLISVPAGLTHMPLLPFLLLTTLGSLAWTAVLTGAGYALESQYSRVEAYVDPISKAVIIAIAGLYLWRVGVRLLAAGRRG